MPSLGLQLRQERERRGISLADIAKDTRISTRYLEAIETDDTRTLPHDFFYRSFIRQYAQYLGLSDAEVQASLQLELSAPKLENPAPEPAPPVSNYEPTQHLKPYTPAYEFLDD
ncbi:MAG: helix-turn-helix domain-containing protein, partial [Bryobacteraceae bacterium]|nr:helix-turn-helix domain-containing protein [Bryobacteraceae bacterium]